MQVAKAECLWSISRYSSRVRIPYITQIKTYGVNVVLVSISFCDNEGQGSNPVDTQMVDYSNGKEDGLLNR